MYTQYTLPIEPSFNKPRISGDSKRRPKRTSRWRWVECQTPRFSLLRCIPSRWSLLQFQWYLMTPHDILISVLGRGLVGWNDPLFTWKNYICHLNAKTKIIHRKWTLKHNCIWFHSYINIAINPKRQKKKLTSFSGQKNYITSVKNPWVFSVFPTSTHEVFPHCLASACFISLNGIAFPNLDP